MQFISLKGVFDFASMVFKFPFNVYAVVHVNMAMDQILRLVTVYQFQKAFEPTVSIAAPITIAGRRSLPVGTVMVAVNIEKRCPPHGHKKG